MIIINKNRKKILITKVYAKYNGVIYDPGGPAIPVNANIPIWDWWWVLVLVPGLVYSYRKLS